MASSKLDLTTAEIYLVKQMIDVTRKSMKRTASGKSPDFQALLERDLGTLASIEAKVGRL